MSDYSTCYSAPNNYNLNFPEHNEIFNYASKTNCILCHCTTGRKKDLSKTSNITSKAGSSSKDKCARSIPLAAGSTTSHV